MNSFLKRLAVDVPLLSVEHLAFMACQMMTADDVQLAEHPMMKRLREQCASKPEMNGDIAVIPVEGALAHRPDPFEMALFGVDDSRTVTRNIQDAASDASVKGVLLRMDTPGGMMLGGPEIADAVALCRQQKPVVAHIGGMGASLGYMIASQANEVIANKSAIVGSIGVIASVADYSALLARIGIKLEHFTNKDAKFKAIGAAGTSLTDEQREHLRQRIESAYGVFKDAVLSARPQVKPEAMQGQTFRGSEAKSYGLIDRVGDENFALGILRGLSPS
jgi:signal peptide peptidase SppA